MTSPRLPADPLRSLHAAVRVNGDRALARYTSGFARIREAAKHAHSDSRAITIAALAVIALAAGIRGGYLLTGAFPLNDGGMFFVMAEDIQAARFGLPSFTTYNGGEIPFAYPPLALYAAALVEATTPLSMADVLRLLPFVFTVFCVWAFWLMAREILDRWAALAAMVAFAVVPRSYIWLLMGGGLPRSLGLAFALLAIRESYLVLTMPPQRRRIVVAGLLCGLTVLTHVETAAFLGATLALMALLKPRVAIRRFALVAAISVLTIAPWFLVVALRHGIEPFTAASSFGGRAFEGSTFSVEWLWQAVRNPVFTSEPYFPIVGALGVIGAAYALGRGAWFLPAWWMLIILLAMRASPTFVTVPLCLLAGVAVVHVLIPAILSRDGGLGHRNNWGTAVVVVGILAFSLYGLTYVRGEVKFLHVMPPEDREAMAWADNNTPLSASFVVVAYRPWYEDSASEWFPAIARRESIATPQGYEWVGSEFRRREEAHLELQACSNQSLTCLNSFMQQATARYVFVPALCCTNLKAEIRTSSLYRVIYDREALIAGYIGAVAAGTGGR